MKLMISRWISERARRCATLVSLSLLAACMGNAADGQRTDSPKGDPWGGSGSGSGSSSSSSGSGSGSSGAGAVSSKRSSSSSGPSMMGVLGGLGMLAKVAENLDEPGPFEAPRSSPGFDEDKPHWLVMTMSGSIVERTSFSFTGGSGTELRAAQKRLASLAADPQLLGVLLRFADLELSFPDAVELRESLKQLRAGGKRVLCHSHGTGNVEYLVMAACDRVAIAPLGQISITGPAAMPVHLRPLLTRFGVVADFLHVGAYKGAAEPFTRDAPSPESAEVLGQILDRHYQTMSELVAADRGLSVAQVKELIDQGVHTPAQAVAARLADDVLSFEALREAQVQGPWTVAKLVEKDGPLSADNPMAAMSSMMQFLGVEPAERPDEPHVALVYALGNIVDGGGDGVLGARQEIAAATLVNALRVLTEDDSVKAVVLRVDSGGGSAQASELIWEAMTALVARKPVVVSMSDVAASGGYYISCGATKIYAEPDTLTGSIGVVGGRLALGAALAQQGVRTYPVGRGKRATMAASLSPWTAEERAVIQRLMEDVYTRFVERVAAGRKKTLDEVRAFAQGRVWTGVKAQELGLVDELGGLEAAYAEAARLGGVAVTAPPELYPPGPTLRDFMVSFGSQTSAGWLGGAEAELQVLGALDPRAAEVARQLLGQLAAFRTGAIQTVTWLPRVR